MKIGIDISAIVYGTGVSDYTSNLVSELLKNGPDNYVLFGASLRRSQEITSTFPSARTFPIPPTLLDLMWNKLHMVGVESLIGKIDVFHSSDWTEPPTRAAKVTTIHDLSPFLYPQEVDAKIVEVHTRKMKWAIKECRKFICVSENTAQDLKRLFSVSSEKIVVIPEALPSRFLKTPRLTKNTNYLVAIGARQPRKNIQRLVSAFLTYRNKLNLPQKLIIIGENSQTILDPAVTYTGYVDDQSLVDLLAGADAFVYPSLYEGFGLPILGAFHHKVPVAAASTSSIPEIAGDAAILFDPLDDLAIAQAIKTAITNRSDLVAQGTNRLKAYTWEKAAVATAAVYTSLC